MDVYHTTYGEWTDYVENGKLFNIYKCPICRSHSGKMKVRTVTETTGGSHKEFKIQCETCLHKGPVHWNKTLAERSWNAQNDPYYERPMKVRVDEK